MTTQPDYKPAVQQSSVSSTFALLKQMAPQIARALPKGMDADRITRLVMTEVRKNPKLADCSRESFSGALLNASALGLEPGVQGECYLVPYNDRRRGLECQLIVGYQGIVKLFWQHPRAQGIKCEAVYANDKIIEYTKGTGGKFLYQPTFGDRGDIVCYYAEAKIAGVTEPLWDVFTPDEIKALRRGKTGGNGDIPDPQHWMERKTALKQVLKLAPKTTRLDMAIRVDDAGTGATQMDVSSIISGSDYIDGEYYDSPQPAAVTAPADVVYPTKTQLAQLDNIREAEGHDAASWLAFLSATVHHPVAEVGELTQAEVQDVIAVFNEEAAK